MSELLNTLLKSLNHYKKTKKNDLFIFYFEHFLLLES